MSWTAILILAGGAYLFKAVGLVVIGPLAQRAARRDPAPSVDGDRAATGRNDRGPADRLIEAAQLLPPALLAALVVSQTVVTGTELTVDARLVGVLAGGTAAIWKKAPFWLVLVIAASVTAAIRAVA